MKKKKRSRKFKTVLLLLLTAIILLSVYVFAIEPNMISTTNIHITDSNSYILDNNSQDIQRDLRIVFFSDLHIMCYRDFHKNIIKKIDEAKPDLILFGGDAIAKITDVNGMEEFFFQLKEIAPVYSIFGNWEEYAPIHMRERYERLDISLIEMDTKVVDIKGKKIGITGLESHYFFPQTNFYGINEENDVNILLIHSPGRLEEYPAITEKYDLILAGHTHGGQFYIPGITDVLMKNSKYFRGKFDIENTLGYVTRGIGQWFPGRFNSVPELVIIDFQINKKVI